MYISKNKKLGFIHIPKTGGRSIFQASKQLPKGYNLIKEKTVKSHAKREDYKGVPPEIWFSIIRHPGERLVSYYHMMIRNHTTTVQKNKIYKGPGGQKVEKTFYLIIHLI